MNQPPTDQQLTDITARWNSRYPIGTPVAAYPVSRPEDDPHAERSITRTRGEAFVFAGTAVVMVDGYERIALTHVDPIQSADTYTPPAKYLRSDGADCCPHGTPVGPGSCEHCWDLVKWDALDGDVAAPTTGLPLTDQQLDEYETALRNADRIGSGIAPSSAAVLLAEVHRLRAETLEDKAEIAKLRDLLGKENKRANAAIDREETAEQAALEAQQERDSVRDALAREERLHGDTIDDRDRIHEAADKLAYAVAPIEVIGEHSSMNDPWENALDHLTPAAEVRRLRDVLTAIRHLHKDSPMGPCPVCIDADRVAAGGDGLVPYPCPTGRLAGAQDFDPPHMRAAIETGTGPCGHDDYHDPHEWADRPGVWCPGISYADDEPAPVVAAVSSAAENGDQP